MNTFLENFHFIRPWLLLSAAPLLLLIHFVDRHRKRQGQWRQLIPQHLANILIDDGNTVKKELPTSLITVMAMVCVIALAGPTWERVEQPLFKVKQAQIIIVDMSLSMYSTDIAPNRLTRAKFKIKDLVSRFTEGETALIAYAGDAFVISPMTSDVANLTNLIPSLNPQIMPVYGSEPGLAVEKALELFKQTNYKQGSIYLITDGMEPSDARVITKILKNTPFKLNILGVGTAQGAPIKLPSEQLLKDDSGNIVIPKLQSSIIRGLSNTLDGHYSNMTHDQSDLNYLAPSASQANQKSEAQENQFGDDWHEVGPYLLLIILPFAALVFRRGILAAVVIVCLMPVSPAPLMAATIAPKQAVKPSQNVKQLSKTPESSWWKDLWATKDQQAHQAYQAKEFSSASEAFNNSQWRGASHYRQDNFEQALEDFSSDNSPEAMFNQANALARLEKYDEAIMRYQSLLEKSPNFPHAKDNLALVEQLGQQKKEQQQSSDQQNDKKQSDEQDQQDSDEQKNSDENNENQDQKTGDSEQQKDSQSPSDEKSSEPSKEQAGNQGDEEVDPQNEEATKQQEEQKAKQKADAKKKQQMFDAKNLTPEELQRLNQLVKKIPDNPSLLLKNKMAVEARKRQHERTATKERKKW